MRVKIYKNRKKLLHARQSQEMFFGLFNSILGIFARQFYEQKINRNGYRRTKTNVLCVQSKDILDLNHLSEHMNGVANINIEKVYRSLALCGQSDFLPLT